MRKLVLVTTVVAALLPFAAAADHEGSPAAGDAAAQPAGGWEAARDLREEDIGGLVGSQVTTVAGEPVGRVDSFTVAQDGIPYAVLEAEGFLGIGAQPVAVPLDQLRIGEDAVLISPQAAAGLKRQAE